MWLSRTRPMVATDRDGKAVLSNCVPHLWLVFYSSLPLLFSCQCIKRARMSAWVCMDTDVLRPRQAVLVVCPLDFLRAHGVLALVAPALAV